MPKKENMPLLKVDINEDGGMSFDFNRKKMDDIPFVKAASDDFTSILHLLTSISTSLLLSHAEHSDTPLFDTVLKQTYTSSEVLLKKLDKMKEKGTDLDENGSVKDFIASALHSSISIHFDDNGMLQTRITGNLKEALTGSDKPSTPQEKNHFAVMVLTLAIASIIRDSIDEGANMQEEVMSAFSCLSNAISDSIPDLEIESGILDVTQEDDDAFEKMPRPIGKQPKKTYFS